MESLPQPPEKAPARAWDTLLFLLCLAVSLIVFAIFKLTVGVDQSWVAGVIGAAVLAAIITAVSYFMSGNDTVDPGPADADAAAGEVTGAEPAAGSAPESAAGSSDASGSSDR